MDFVALIGIAVGLSKDAFAVSVTNGAVCQKNNLKFAAKLALSFGFFQALMPTIGWLAGKAAENFISSVDHWVALILLGFIGTQMLIEAFKNEKEEETCQLDVPPKNAYRSLHCNQHRRPCHRYYSSLCRGRFYSPSHAGCCWHHWIGSLS